MRLSISVCLLVLWAAPRARRLAQGGAHAAAQGQLRGGPDRVRRPPQGRQGRRPRQHRPVEGAGLAGRVRQGAGRRRRRPWRSCPRTPTCSPAGPSCCTSAAGTTRRSKAADAALAVKDKHFLARWVRAQVFRDRGDAKDADAEVKRIVRIYGDVVNTADEIKTPEDLVVVGLASAENARWNGLADEFQAILEDLYGDAVKFDKDFWPGEYQAGMLLLEKYNRGEALDAFDKALKINPSASEALVGQGVVGPPADGDQGRRALRRARPQVQPAPARGAAAAGRRLPRRRRLRQGAQGAGPGAQGQPARRAHAGPRRGVLPVHERQEGVTTPSSPRSRRSRRSRPSSGSSSASGPTSGGATTSPSRPTRRRSPSGPSWRGRRTTSACSTRASARRPRARRCSTRASRSTASTCASPTCARSSTTSPSTRRSRASTSSCATTPRPTRRSGRTSRSSWSRSTRRWRSGSTTGPRGRSSSRSSRRTTCSAAGPSACRTCTRSGPAPAASWRWCRRTRRRGRASRPASRSTGRACCGTRSSTCSTWRRRTTSSRTG